MQAAIGLAIAQQANYTRIRQRFLAIRTMNKPLIAALIPKFLEIYDSAAKDAIWQQHSAAFRRFWSERVLSEDNGTIPDEACDTIIRILDRQGKGNTKESEAVAGGMMMPQNVWRKLFNSLHTDRKLARLVDSIFRESDASRKAAVIDALYAANRDRKNRLTGESGNVLDSMLAAYDPVKNLAVVSLKDRKTQIEFLDLKLPFEWDIASPGIRIVQSNELLREGTRALGLDGTARTEWPLDKA